MFFFVKKILPVVLILSCLISLSSCQIDLYDILEEFDKQNIEQTSVQATEQTTETVKNDDSDDTEETQAETTPQKVFNNIFISESGVLRLEYDPKLEPPYSKTARELTHVKKCMARIKRTQAMVTLDRKKPQGWGTDSYFDYI